MNDLFIFITHILIDLLVGACVLDSVKSEIYGLYDQLRKIDKTIDEIKKSLWITSDDD